MRLETKTSFSDKNHKVGFIYFFHCNTIALEYKVISDNYTFTFMHLADAFIQNDLQSIQDIYLLVVHVFPGNWTHDLCAANTMLYHWATGTHYNYYYFILH